MSDMPTVTLTFNGYDQNGQPMFVQGAPAGTTTPPMRAPKGGSTRMCATVTAGTKNWKQVCCVEGKSFGEAGGYWVKICTMVPRSMPNDEVQDVVLVARERGLGLARARAISSPTAQAIFRGGMVPGTTKRQRRAIRKMQRQHPSCPPEAPVRCRNGLCVDHWSQCPDKLTF